MAGTAYVIGLRFSSGKSSKIIFHYISKILLIKSRNKLLYSWLTMQKRIFTLQLISISERRRYFLDELLFDVIFTHNYCKIVSPSLFCGGFKLCAYTSFSELICFLKTLSHSWLLEVQHICHFFFWWTSTIFIHGCQRRGRQAGTPLPPGPLCPSFLLLHSLFWLLRVLENFQACHRRIFKMKLSFRSRTMVIYTQRFNLNHYCILSFSFYNNPLNAFKYGDGIATCRSKWNPDDL